MATIVGSEKLTDREIEYLKLACTGYQASRIAEKMRITPSGVAQISNRVRKKLKAKTVGHAVYIATTSNLIPLK